MGFYERMQQRLSDGSFSEREAQRLDAMHLQDEKPIDESFINRPGGPTPEEIDAERAAAHERSFRPITDPATDIGPQAVSPTPPEWSRHDNKPRFGGSDTAQAQGLETASDLAQGFAGGTLSGAGVNPGELLGEDVARRQALANERSPIAAPIGRIAGEMTTQAVAAPAKLAALGPTAVGAVGGGLSAIGNTVGDWKDKLVSGVEGTIFGGALGNVAGKLQSLLPRGSDTARRISNRQYMRQGGAATGDLNAIDRDIPGGVQGLAERSREQKIGSRMFSGPDAYSRDAAKVANAAEAERDVLSAGAPRINTSRAASAMRNAGMQGVPPTQLGLPGAISNTVEGQVGAINDLGWSKPVPWEHANDLRKLLGKKTNWSNDPAVNDAAMQRMHGALNDTQADALSRTNPGAGARWRQLGRNERDAFVVEGFANQAINRRSGVGPGDAAMAAGGWAGGGGPVGAGASVLAGRAIRANLHAMNKNVVGAAGGAMDMAGGLSPGLGPLAAAQVGTPERLDQTALDVLHAGGHELGPYKAQFAEAAGSPAPGAVNDLITRLTMTDPKFRQTLLPLLRNRSRTSDLFLRKRQF